MPTSTPPPHHTFDSSREQPATHRSPAAEGLTEAQQRDLVRELTAELGRVTRRLELASDDADDSAIAADIRAALLDRQDTITDALQRVASNRYGVCVDCHAHIPYGRLLLQPEAERCAECAVIT